MSAIAFDTLSSAKRLRAKGFTEAQAEAITEEMQKAHDVNIEHLATKADVREVELRLKVTIGTMIVGLGAFLAAIKFFG